MMLNKPTSSKDHLKRFLQKNKTIKSSLILDVSKNKQMKKKSNAKCSFIQCSPLIDVEKIQKLNENLMYKRILMAEDSYNGDMIDKNRLGHGTKQSFDTQKKQTHKLLKNSKIFRDYKSNQRSKQILRLQSLSMNLNKSLKMEDFKNNSSEIMNFTTPLQIWKQLSKQYKKKKTKESTIESLCKKRKKQKLMKQRLKCFIQTGKLIQEGQKSIVNEFIEKYWKKDDIKISKKQQNQLQENIILRRSFSCDDYQQSKVNFDTIFFKQKDNIITTNQSLTQSKHHSRSPKQSEKNSVILLHKQPLESYIQNYFNPIKSLQRKQQLSPIVSRQIIRIKSKKLTQRSIEHLERIKNKLFKQKSRKNILDKQQIITFKKASKRYSKQNFLTTFSTLSTQKPSRRSSKKQNYQQLFGKKPQKEVQKNVPQKKLSKNLQKIPQLIHLKVAQNKSLPQSHTNTPSIKRVTPTSSVISFGQQPNYEKNYKKEQKCQSFFNAW